MASPRPNTITSLADAYKNCKPGPAHTAPQINLMGIVIDVLPPTLTRAGEWSVTFTIQDLDMMKLSVFPKGLKARFFTRSQEELPPIPSVGDIILMRSCRVILYQNVPTINNIKRVTNTVVYQATSIPDAGFRQSFLGDKDIPCLPQDAFPRPSKAEQMYALSLKQLTPSVVIAANTSNTTAISAGPAAGTAGGPPSRNTKFRLIQSVNYNDYCDIAVEVIKKFPNSNGNMELYVTDYTQNNNLYHYPDPDEADADDDFSREGDPYGYLANVTGKRKDWPGPSGRHTLQVELLPPHAGFARDRVQEGDFVKLSNVRIKQGSAGKMEGNIWTDRHYPEKIQVNKLIEEKHLKDLTARRDKYWEAHKNPAEQEVTKKPGKKARNKKQKEKKAREAAIGTDGVESASSDVVHNKHVKCVKHDVDVSTIRDMQALDHSYTGKSGLELMLPLNVLYKIRARVVDFWPSVLEDFASLASPAVGSGEDSDNDIDMIDLSSSEKWRWDFYLLLEDIKPDRPSSPPAQQWVHVEHSDAEFLLGMDEDATDLRRDPQTLAKVREQMAILWGNLEELKVAASQNQQPFPSREGSHMGLSNLPFYCCIKEYGQELDEEDRPDEFSTYTTLYALASTRIFGSGALDASN